MKAITGWRKRYWRRGRTLPLRLWLILAVAAITGAGFLAQMGLTAVITVVDQQVEQARMASVRQLIGTDPARWHDPSWQHHAGAALAALGVDLALYTVPPGTQDQPVTGQPIYATAAARGFLGSGVGAPPAAEQASRAPVFERVDFAIPTSSATLGQPRAAVALLWLAEPPPGDPPQALWPAVELGAFAFTLAIVVWLVGQPVLRPLAEMSQAAQAVAGGDPDFELAEPSPVREIAEVSDALQGMSTALRDSLARQSALEEERRLFVGAVAHDLRTPLFILRGYLKGLASGVASTPEKMARYIQMCRTQADALDRRIADLFAYTRLEYLEQEPERVPIDFGALLRETVDAAQPLAAAKGIALVASGPGEQCNALGDRHLLVRALENLLDNALRHTPSGGQIHVRWRQEAERIVFSVEDTGPGIPAEELPHLFHALYRGEESRNRQSGGAGLGLTIARSILRAHDGDLTAANASSGGAIFIGTLSVARHIDRASEHLVSASDE
jgi:signal transduction histidine kinase